MNWKDDEYRHLKLRILDEVQNELTKEHSDKLLMSNLIHAIDHFIAKITMFGDLK